MKLKNIFSMQPQSNHFVVKEVVKEKTDSGIFIPADSSKHTSQEGVVVAIPEDTIHDNIKIDDTVIFRQFSGEQIQVDGKWYLVISDEDLIARRIHAPSTRTNEK